MLVHERILRCGVLNVGDVLIIKDSSSTFPAQVKYVINKGKKSEEIVIAKKKNMYFIMDMLINNQSWVKECYRITGAEMFSLSNTTKRYPR